MTYQYCLAVTHVKITDSNWINIHENLNSLVVNKSANPNSPFHGNGDVQYWSFEVLIL